MAGQNHESQEFKMRDLAERSADFPVRSNLERSTAPKNSATPLFLDNAADWKVRAPFLNPPCLRCYNSGD